MTTEYAIETTDQALETTDQTTELAEQLAGLTNKDALAEVGRLLEEHSEETIFKVVGKDLDILQQQDGEAAGVGIVTTLVFRGAQWLNEHGQAAQGGAALRGAVLACVERICEDGDADTKRWNAVGDRLVEAVAQLDGRTIIDAAFQILAELRASGTMARAFENFLPLAVEAMGAVGAVELTAGAADSASVVRTGEGLRAYWIDAACACRWEPAAAVRISVVLGEACGIQTAVVARRVQQQLQYVAVKDQATLAGQLLRLARGGAAQQREIAGGVLRFFDKRADEGPAGAAQQQLAAAVRRDAGLGDALVAHGRALAADAGEFTLGSLLALARVPRFGEALGLVRTHVARAADDEQRLAAAPWVRGHVPAGRGIAAQLDSIVQRAACGWEQAAQALVQTAVVALTDTRQPAAQRVALDTLRAAFAQHSFVRGEIVAQIAGRAAADTDADTDGEPFLKLLKLLSADDPEALRPHTARLVDALETAGALAARCVASAAAAAGGARAPLLLVLRKRLFAQAVESRLAALAGLAAVARAAATALAAGDGGARTGLLEAVGLLRRGMTQQAEVRTAAYGHIAQLLMLPNTSRALGVAVGGVLRAELARVLPSGTAMGAALERCLLPGLDRVAVPLAELLRCISRLVAAGGAEPQLATRWADVRAQMARLQPDDIVPDAPELRRRAALRVAAECADVAAEHALDAGDAEQAATLLAAFGRLVAADDVSQMTLDSAMDALALALPDAARLRAGHALGTAGFAAAVQAAAPWASDAAAVRHVLGAAVARVNAGSAATAQVLRLAYVVLSGAIMHMADSDPPQLLARPARGRGVAQLCADALAACTAALSPELLPLLPVAALRPRPALFAEPLEPPVETPAELAACATELLSILRRAADALLARRPAGMREAASLLAAARDVAAALPADASAGEDMRRSADVVAAWASTLPAADVPPDAALLRNAVALTAACQPLLPPLVAPAPPLSELRPPPPPSPDADRSEFAPMRRVVLTLCRAARLLPGALSDDEDSQNDDDDVASMRGLTPRTVPAVAAAIALWLRHDLRQAEWAATQLRRLVPPELELRGPDDDLLFSIGLERRVCARLAALAELILLPLLACTQLPPVASDHVLRAVLDLHRALAGLTRAKLAYSALPVTEAFTQLLSLVCTRLNTHVYAVLVDKYGCLPQQQHSLSSQSKAAAKDKNIAGKKAATTKSSKSARSRVMRNSSIVSSLVYQIELTEKYVVQLGAKLKTPLAHYLKRSTARDFRIEVAAVPDHLPYEEHVAELDSPSHDPEGFSDGVEAADDVLVSEDNGDPNDSGVGHLDLPDPDDSDNNPNISDNNDESPASKRLRQL
ncbi:hypothetical protein COEREDRAFT_85239 [Coemansia reversa NRRL 1564]|uniref:FANCI solenoid 4 domain-containing protein n=1 Tax=Coemansia reversa (strain ATCC 12441 / NRRL 1564) TaxID=763665 RepID=A0A2G5BGU4_COERN|nr:hypothetical protein COEREDRAFT_85239 [Coemansia reversa NRRL 1564]|eukprot:PIA18244.1 hypothetical protein COEREDRAFT_85239 [Coemansia reversa NRRL 1564]